MIKHSLPPDPLVRFLYILMRDHLPSGAVEEIMEKHVEKLRANVTEIVFTNGYLAHHAADLAARLRGAGSTELLASVELLASAPGTDTNPPTTSDVLLHEAAQQLIAAAMAYWKEYRRVTGGAAVVWVSDDDGGLVVLTRGEYRETLMTNIARVRSGETLYFDRGSR